MATAVKTYVLTLTKWSKKTEHGGVIYNPWGTQKHDSGKSKNWYGIVMTIFKIFAYIIMFKKNKNVILKTEEFLFQDKSFINVKSRLASIMKPVSVSSRGGEVPERGRQAFSLLCQQETGVHKLSLLALAVS